ncbi:3-oxoacyl-reductase [Halenospora varia]|nr:3-oxoacyl-reductase [Halenospora varia]
MPSESSHLPLQGKTALVTGSSRGLGAGMALELAKKGVDIIITYTSSSSRKLVSTLQEEIRSLPHKPNSIAIQIDLRDPTAPSQIVSEIQKWRGTKDFQLNILVNNAGSEIVKPLGDISVEDFNQIYTLNVLAPLLLTQSLLPYMPPNSRIINISSVGARSGFPSLSLYCSSKAALEALTRCWASELGDNGTTVNSVAPGPVESEMLGNIPRGVVEKQMEGTPVGKRLGTVEEVGRVVCWLASPDSSWITGQTINTSGGWTMY